MSNHKDDIYNQEYLGHKQIQERRKFVMADVSGRGKEVIFEVNWNSFVRKNGFVKITIDGNDAVVSREHLWAILFMLGNAEEQEKMVSPFMKKTLVKKFFKVIGVTTTRDIKKGEVIKVPLDFTFNPDDNSIVIGKGSGHQIGKLKDNNSN